MNRRHWIWILLVVICVYGTTHVIADDMSFVMQQAQKEAQAQQQDKSDKTAPPDQLPSASSSAPIQSNNLNSNDATIDAANYILSEELEKNNFNVDDKQRFFGVPDGLGRVQMVEQRAELGLAKLVTNQDKIMNEAQLAANYRQVAAAEIVDAVGAQCVTEKALKKAKALGRLPLGVWPLKPLDDSLPVNYIKIGQTAELVQLISYASTVTATTYYWPMVIFLDDKGCILSGATHFFQDKKPATTLSHAALLGTIFIPDRTSYIMLTPLQQSADLAGVTLKESGQIQLKIVKPITE